MAQTTSWPVLVPSPEKGGGLGGGGGGGVENKLLNQNCLSRYHFSQKLLKTLIPVIASTYCERYAVPFFLGHPVYNPPWCTPCFADYVKCYCLCFNSF